MFAVFKNINDEMITLAPIILMMEVIHLSGNKDLLERNYRAMMESILNSMKIQRGTHILCAVFQHNNDMEIPRTTTEIYIHGNYVVWCFMSSKHGQRNIEEGVI